MPKRESRDGVIRREGQRALQLAARFVALSVLQLREREGVVRHRIRGVEIEQRREGGARRRRVVLPQGDEPLQVLRARRPRRDREQPFRGATRGRQIVAQQLHADQVRSRCDELWIAGQGEGQRCDRVVERSEVGLRERRVVGCGRALRFVRVQREDAREVRQRRLPIAAIFSREAALETLVDLAAHDERLQRGRAGRAGHRRLGRIHLRRSRSARYEQRPGGERRRTDGTAHDYGVGSSASRQCVARAACSAMHVQPTRPASAIGAKSGGAAAAVRPVPVSSMEEATPNPSPKTLTATARSVRTMVDRPKMRGISYQNSTDR